LKVLEELKQLRTFHALEEPEIVSAWNNLLAAAHHQRFDDDKIPIESEITQHIVDRLDFKFLTLYVLNHLSDHICQLGNLLNPIPRTPQAER
jgi:hypothetical protein